ncbi:MAG: hypothetical protein COV72_09285, partial [Candidatus Omnitrophica bacterium CG11_big_fil_rev_8_21_14_0_20_42_13]
MNRQRIFAVLLIVILGFACYFNALSVPFIWDDVGLVSGNYLIKDFRYTGKIFTADLYNGKSEGQNFYRPVQSLSYMLDYHFWKLNPLGYHITNIILHIATAILIYLLVSFLTPAVKISQAPPTPRGSRALLSSIPLLTALLFVVHPVHVEAVTYISGRADILAALFMLSALLFFIKWLKGNKSAICYLLSVICFIIALFSKEFALILPVLLLLYVFACRFNYVKEYARRIYVYIPFLLAGAFYLSLRLLIVANKTVFPPKADIYKNILFFPKAAFLYLKTIILPLNLHMSRAVRLPESILSLDFIFPALGLALMSFLIFKMARTQKAKLVSFALVWFLINLVPYSGLFQINAYFAEHFAYLASVGIFLIIAIGFKRLISLNKGFLVLPAILLIFYGVISIRYNYAWRDPERFYKRIISLSPMSYHAYNNLAAIAEQKGDYREAEKLYLKSLSANDAFSNTYFNLIRVIYLSGREEPALIQMEDLIKKHPDNFWAWANLGSMYANRKEYPQAIDAYRKSLEINPGISTHHYFLALTLKEAGNNDAAIDELKRAIELDASDFHYHYALALIYKNKGIYSLALDEYKKALSLEPRNAAINLNLGIVYDLMGDYSYAEKYLLKAKGLDNNSANARYNLGVFYWSKGRYDEAKEELETSLKIDPEFQQAKT